MCAWWLTLVGRSEVGHHISHECKDTTFSTPGIAELLLRPDEGFLESVHPTLHLRQPVRILGIEATIRRALSIIVVALLGADRLALDAVQIGLAASLEVGVLELPDVLLDLTRLFVDMLDLSRQLEYGLLAHL